MSEFLRLLNSPLLIPVVLFGMACGAVIVTLRGRGSRPKKTLSGLVVSYGGGILIGGGLAVACLGSAVLIGPFANLAPPTTTPAITSLQPLTGKIGDYVWHDSNRDGLQDSGEDGVHFIKIRLFGASDNLEGTTSTDESGYYEFADVASGTYYLEFINPGETEFTVGSGFTDKDVGDNDDVDSDANKSTGRTDEFSYQAGDTQMNWDAGMLFKAYGEYCETCHPPNKTKTPTPSPQPPTLTPTPWRVYTPGNICKVTATFSGGWRRAGSCLPPESFETPLEITVSEDGATVSIFWPLYNDTIIGPLNMDGSFTAQSQIQLLDGLFTGEACTGEINNYEYIDVHGCEWVYPVGIFGP